METDDGFAPLGTEEVVDVGAVVLKEVFGEHSRASGVAQDSKSGCPVFLRRHGASCFQPLSPCSIMESAGKSEGARGRISCNKAAPTSGIMPAAIGTGSIAMD